MEKKVEQFIFKHHLFQSGETVIIGVSGGPDSMALLHFLNQRRETYQIKLVCCSIDHGLRGEESAEDVRFVREMARKWEIPFEGRSIDVPTFMKKKKVGTQEAARSLRFETFRQVLNLHKAHALALAHHGDDQIETMLMQHVRGGIGRSLSGMPVVKPMEWGGIIRPFLCVTKDEILEYCRENKIPYRQDPSNETDHYTRNRFRHHVLPFLKKENPKVHERFQQQSEWMLAEGAFLDQLARDYLIDIGKSSTGSGGEYVLSQEEFLKAPLPLQRRMLHLILSYLYQSHFSDKLHQSIHIDLLINWLESGRDSGEWTLPGDLVARKENGHLFIKVNPTVSKPSQMDIKKLPIPGHLSTPVGEFKIEKVDRWSDPRSNQSDFIADFDALNLPLTLRFFKSGDRMTLLGRKGTKKINRLFIDSKVPKEWRENWPLLVDGQDRIIWVPLLKRSDIGMCGKKTTSFIKIVFRPSEDFGRIL